MWLIDRFRCWRRGHEWRRIMDEWAVMPGVHKVQWEFFCHLNGINQCDERCSRCGAWRTAVFRDEPELVGK